MSGKRVDGEDDGPFVDSRFRPLRRSLLDDAPIDRGRWGSGDMRGTSHTIRTPISRPDRAF